MVRLWDGMSSRRIDGIICIPERPQLSAETGTAGVYSQEERPKQKAAAGLPCLQRQAGTGSRPSDTGKHLEPNFSENSHGFRPRKSCHTALLHLQRTFTGAKWFVEGDIKACFDDFDHHVLIDILRRRIDDEAFIALMWKFLKAGYMEQWEYHKTYSGTPQGSGISPILANIYLNELDRHITEYKAAFDCGSSTKRKVNPEYERMRGTIKRAQRRNAKMWDELDEAERKQKAAEIRYMKTEHRKLSRSDPFDANYKSLQYIRYADDFIIGVIGSKEDAEAIKSDLANYLREKLKLTLSAEKTKITHTSGFARFLGYDITVSRSQEVKKSKKGYKSRVYSAVVKLYTPHEKYKANCWNWEQFVSQRTVPDRNTGKPSTEGNL